MANTIKLVEILVIQRVSWKKILTNGKKTKTEQSIMLPVKAYSNSDRKEEMCGKKKKEIVVFFQISLESKQMKQYFLEWAKHHSNRWQKCRHAREQVYELTYGCFLSWNVETAAFGELFQLLHLQNFVITRVPWSLLKIDMDFISWFLFSVFW